MDMLRHSALILSSRQLQKDYSLRFTSRIILMSGLQEFIFVCEGFGRGLGKKLLQEIQSYYVLCSSSAFYITVASTFVQKRKYCELSITRIKKNIFCCMYLHNLLVHSYGKFLSFLFIMVILVLWYLYILEALLTNDTQCSVQMIVNVQSRACSFSMLSLSKECYL